MLTHVDAANRPTMVDVGDKQVTRRTAEARAFVVFPDDAAVSSGEALRTKKGPVFDTAIIAGVMAAKRTHELIPFCHAIALEDCKISIEWSGPKEIVVQCSVRATHKTGVEMEALTGVTAAALTIYDMCKALTHGIRIRDVELVSKTGGKRDFRSDEPAGRAVAEVAHAAEGAGAAEDAGGAASAYGAEPMRERGR